MSVAATGPAMTVAATAPARAVMRALPEGVRIAPSILAADYARLGQQVGDVLHAGARIIHCDVMDGHFVPPITFGAGIVAALSDQVHEAGGLVDVHLMVERPERHVAEFARAGADLITVHAEATPHLHYALAAVRDAGCLAGLALNPGTDATCVAELAAAVDLVLCMTVNPGWGGQRFIGTAAPKISRLRSLIGAGCALQVDGGIDRATAPACADRGATVLVAGSAVFGEADPARAYGDLCVAVGAA